MLYFNLISLFLIVAGAVVLGMQTPEISASARVYPLIMIALVSVCSLVIAVKEIAGRAATEPLDRRFAKILAASRPQRMRVLAFIVAWLVYFWALSAAGFLVATTAAISVSLWLLKTKSIFVAILAATLFSVVLAVLFATVLYIPTPMGPLDEMLIQAIYAMQKH